MAKKNSTSAAPVAAPSAPVAAPGLVTVYCALPSGITFRLPDGRELTFNGVNSPRGSRVLTAGRYGITPGVAKDDWEWVARTYAEVAYFTAQPPLLHACADPRDGDARAREVSGDTRTGMEQVDVHAEAATQTEPEGR